MSKKNVKSEANKKPYCKVCHDAGKVESVYTSHWVKDLTGKTTCPTLLSTECRYCYKLGHTTKFCDVLAKNNLKAERRSQAAATRKEPAQKKKPQNTALVMGNGFSALCDDSESEEEVSNTNTIVQSEAKRVEPEVKTGWAAIVAKPKEVQGERGFAKPVVVQNTGLLLLSKKPIQEAVEQPKPVVEAKLAPWANKAVVLTKSWADWSDSEDEDEDEPAYMPYNANSGEKYTDAWD